MGFIDCDSHVIEDESTWEHLDPDEEQYRPRMITLDSPLPGMKNQRLWLAGDTWAMRFDGTADLCGNANLYDPQATHLQNVGTRLDDMDALGVDVALLFSTFFIGVELVDPLAEAALTRSFNRWMAERSADCGGRLKWALRAPTQLMERAFEELEFGKAHGAAGIHVRGIENGRYLADPYFWPLYERAQDLDLAILVHVGATTRRSTNVPIGNLVPTPGAYIEHLATLMAGFHSVLASDFDQRFPRLRWGFLEGGAAWVPTVLHQQMRVHASRNKFLQLSEITPEILAAKQMFVACQATEDLAYLTEVLGHDVLVVGSDYGHNDSGTELGAHQSISERGDLEAEVARSIVDDNGRRLLAVDPAFDPAPPEARTRRLPHVRPAPVDLREPILVGSIIPPGS